MSTAAAQLCITGRPDEAQAIIADLRAVRGLDIVRAYPPVKADPYDPTDRTVHIRLDVRTTCDVKNAEVAA